MYAMNRETVLKRLRDFDAAAKERIGQIEPKPRVVIMGGSALLLLGRLDRVTHDIDILTVPRELNELIVKYDMNSGVKAYIDCLPYNYEDRLVIIDIGDTCLEYLTPSLEDLVVTKLYGMRPPDIEDLRSEEIVEKMDWELLEFLVFDKDEAKASSLSERRYIEMTKSFMQYKKEFYHEGINIPRIS